MRHRGLDALDDILLLHLHAIQQVSKQLVGVLLHVIVVLVVLPGHLAQEVM
jgi:hypothetical protein